MTEQSQSFQIYGDVGHQSFGPWIRRHARRLGLRGQITQQAAGRLDLVAAGQIELLDALALGCSLGPQEVWVDRIERGQCAPIPSDAKGSWSD